MSLKSKKKYKEWEQKLNINVALDEKDFIETIEDDFRDNCESYIPSAHSRFIIRNLLPNALDKFQTGFRFNPNNGEQYYIVISGFEGELFGVPNINANNDGNASLKFEANISIINIDTSEKLTENVSIYVTS
jgi:hypothetical protein